MSGVLKTQQIGSVQTESRVVATFDDCEAAAASELRFAADDVLSSSYPPP
ncbi:hypothetical protein RchiOBHm_Chr1g0329691 [Rosa chinensis]|uniref:Uncharacterized protein n=1 Tax=Rosa chinensis TaxID=74649 RepID=A0A2P6SB47_ROSCH|nr:hypothetical protein RchiOBHm_Chr1g0329691 [Rosa chinensis]